MTLEEQKALDVLGRIVELNKEKARIAFEINELLNSLAGVSAKIGELGASLKPQLPTEN